MFDVKNGKEILDNNRKRPIELIRAGNKRARLDRRNQKDRDIRKNESEEAKNIRLTPQQRGARLVIMSTQQQKRRASETPEARGARLEQLSTSKKQHLATETPLERSSRLQKLSTSQKQRLAMETPEKKASRLQNLTTSQKQHLATQTSEERAARLHKLSTLQKERLAPETLEERTERLENIERSRAVRQATYPGAHQALLEQENVQKKMARFHQDMSLIECHTCSTCMENFPGVKFSTHTSQCLRYSRDNITPKLYSAENNMHPGSASPQLQVLYIIKLSLTISIQTSINNHFFTTQYYLKQKYEYYF